MFARIQDIARFVFLTCLLLSLVFVAGCQPGNLSADLDQIEEPDYSCAYFYFLWGRQAELSMRLPEALEAYEKALICDSDADYIMRKIPLVLLRMDRGEEAVLLLKQYLEKIPEDAGVMMLLARVYISLGMNESAAQQYRTIHRLNPEETSSLMLLSELYLNQSNLPEAEKVLQQVLAGKPDSYPAHVLLGRIYLSTRQFDRALTEYDRALEISWSTELLLEKSDVYGLQEDYDKLIALYREILEADPDDERVAVSLVNYLLLVKKEKEALAELHKLKSRSTHSDRVDLSIARFYARLQKFDEAAVNLRKYLEKNNASDARYLLAVILSQSKQYDQALTELQMISSDADEYENGLALQVRILRFQKRPDKAVELLERVLKDEKTHNPDFYVMLAALYHLQDRTELGRTTFDRALLAFPDDEDLLYEYGLFLDTTGDSEEALSVMQEVIKRKPEHGEALNYVGYSWADKNINLEQALGYIKKAVQLKPENGYIRDSLGWVYYRLGRHEEALKELSEASRLSPTDPTILEHLADVYLELGRKDEALKTYRKSIELFDDDSNARETLEEKILYIESRTP